MSNDQDNTPMLQAGGGTDADMFASPKMAYLYVKQGDYERGIAMYRHLIKKDPDNTVLTEQLQDAELLADLLILRDDRQRRDQAYQEGFKAGRSEELVASNQQKIVRLNAWLNRIQDQT